MINSMMRQQAKIELAKQITTEFNPDNDNHFLIVNLDPTLLSDPLHPEWEGGNLSKLKRWQVVAF